jgi:hypothetical protein
MGRTKPTVTVITMIELPLADGPISSEQRPHFTVPVATIGANRRRSSRCGAPYFEG